MDESLWDVVAVNVKTKEVGGVLRVGLTKERVYKSANIHQSQTVNELYYVDIVESGSHKVGDTLDEGKSIL